MKQKHFVQISYLATGHVIQDIEVDEGMTADRLVSMLYSGDASTTIHEDNDVMDGGGSVLGTVLYSETELEFSGFQAEDTYTLDDDAKPFDMSHLVRAGAIGEFIYEPEKSVTEIMQALVVAGGSEPMLTVEELYSGLSGKQLLKEIDLMERGLRSLMQLAYNAGKDGQEIV